MKILKTTAFAAFLFALCLTGFVYGSYHWFSEMCEPVFQGRTAKVIIPSGANQRQIAATLKSSGVIKSALIFRIYTRLLAVDNRLRPGEYTFKGNESLNQVIFMLLKGNLPTVPVTIPEGLKNDQVAEMLDINGICNANDFLEAVSDPELLGKIFANWDLIPAAEGLAFPDTYHFFKPTPAVKVAENMLRLTKHQIDRCFPDALPQGLTQYQGCILASIIEKEAAIASEHPLMASVFYNRLEKKMKLKSCATVLYALGEHKTRLLFEDLKVASPYNTYLNAGLPPTPIANFGVSAMKAVFAPEKTDFLFFVADGQRGHSFSKTLNQHNLYRKRYFEIRKKGAQ